MVWSTNLAAAGTAVSAQDCTDGHLVCARGTNQPAGLGSCGTPLFSGLTAALQDKTVSAYAVDYAADTLQTSAGSGATDMTKHIGATVTDIAIGIDTILSKGQVIPTSLAPRIKAGVTFGNPLRLSGRTIAKESSHYGTKSIDYCNKGDPVCAAGLNTTAHMTYPKNSSTGGCACCGACALAVALPKGSTASLSCRLGVLAEDESAALADDSYAHRGFFSGCQGEQGRFCDAEPFDVSRS